MIVITVRDTGTRTDDIDVQSYYKKVKCGKI